MQRPHVLMVGTALLLVALAGAAAEDPELAVEEGRWLTLSRLPPVLGGEAVTGHLTSGLTTMLVFRAEGARNEAGKVVGAARVDIRYEPWDEVFLLTVIEADGGVRRERVPSRDELERWWAALRLRLFDLEAEPPYTAERVRVALDLVPFSHAEQLDTQRWFSESVHRGGQEGAGASSSAGEDPGLAARIFNLLLATSIQRRPVASFEWTLSSPRELHGE